MDNLVQIRITQRVVIAEGRQRTGTVLWVSADRARDMIDQRVAEAVGAGLPGPSETKPQDPSEKKFSGAAPAGPSTDSPRSSQPGVAPQPSASPAVPALTRFRSVISRITDPTGPRFVT